MSEWGKQSKAGHSNGFAIKQKQSDNQASSQAIHAVRDMAGHEPSYGTAQARSECLAQVGTPGKGA